MQKSVDIVNQAEAQIAEIVVESIHSVMHLFRAQQYRALRDGPHDLTQMEARVLGFFSRRIGATLSDLVSHTGRDKGQLARLISSLRERGLLEGKADEEDRRSLRLYLTRDGAAIHRTLHRQRQRLSSLAVEGLTAVEREQLLAVLAKVRVNLEKAS